MKHLNLFRQSASFGSGVDFGLDELGGTMEGCFVPVESFILISRYLLSGFRDRLELIKIDSLDVIGSARLETLCGLFCLTNDVH